MTCIDLNCDMGESFGSWQMGQDAQVMPWITSANIACGFHAGDFSTMLETVRLAHEHHVAIGAHVSLPDLQGFGRRDMRVTPGEVYQMTLYQIGALAGFTRAVDAHLAHVKPHGALHTMAARDASLADAIAHAIRDFDPGLMLYGLAGSALPLAASRIGLHSVHEAFADRRYEPDGMMTPRHEPGAVIDNIDAAVAQAVEIATTKSIKSRDGSLVPLHADSICVHGDRPDAAEYAQRLHRELEIAGVDVLPPERVTAT